MINGQKLLFQNNLKKKCNISLNIDIFEKMGKKDFKKNQIFRRAFMAKKKRFFQSDLKKTNFSFKYLPT